jgi:double-strand break repair protein MRE11
MASDEDKDVDTLRILVATDTHCGYNEHDKVRGNDAMNTFEEILQIAREKKVDLILHGGDLFHDNKPSRKCLYRAMDLIKKYCFGPGEVLFQVVSEQTMFSNGCVNYEDPNVNVDLPLFMIHGNHDDPGGESNLSVMNLLEVSGLVNYFGRPDDLEDIVVKPLLLRKGRTQLSLHGLGNIRDERLNRAFQNRKVRFETPSDPEQWFNMLMLHQNRHKGDRGGLMNKACIHEQMLPQFLDLVIWGHEHDCLVSPQESLRGEFYVVQPGSSVATALTPGETQMKHVAVIDVNQGRFKCTPVPLYSVRPLIMSELVLSETGLLKTDTQSIWHALTAEVDNMITQGVDECQRRAAELAKRDPAMQLSGKPVESPDLPLIRLRVEHTGFETITGNSFGQQFIDRVANPDEILLFHRRRGSDGAASGVDKRKVEPLGDVLVIEEAAGSGHDNLKVQDIIYKYLDGEQSLAILSEPDLNEAVQSFVHKAEPMAIERFVSEAVTATNMAVTSESHAVEEEEIRVQMQDRTERIRQQRLAQAPEIAAAVANIDAHEPAPAPVSGGAIGSQAPAGIGGARSRSVQQFPAVEQASLADADIEVSSQASSRGRGRGGRGSRGGRGGRGSKRTADTSMDRIDGFFAPPAAPASKLARSSAPTATPARSGARDWLIQAAGQGVESSQPGAVEGRHTLASTGEAAAPAVFMERRRAVTTANEPSFGGLGGPDTGLEVGGSLKEAEPKRQWALRKSN